MNEYTISFDYHFHSGLGPMEGGRYNKMIHMDIYIEDDLGSSTKLIGKCMFHMIYIDHAVDAGYDLYEIFDDKEYTFRLGQNIFDFEECDINEDIRQFYDYNLMQQNICILERLELLPEFRGQKIGAKVIKDIIFHFSSGCVIFVAQVFPLQFEPSEDKESEWRKILALGNFKDKESKAFSKLKNYYLSIGFDEIPNYNGLLFLNPICIDERLSSVYLED